MNAIRHLRLPENTHVSSDDSEKTVIEISSLRDLDGLIPFHESPSDFSWDGELSSFGPLTATNPPPPPPIDHVGIPQDDGQIGGIPTSVRTRG